MIKCSKEFSKTIAELKKRPGYWIESIKFSVAVLWAKITRRMKRK